MFSESILYIWEINRNSSESVSPAEAAGVMELTAADLKRKGIIDTIIAEPKGGAHICFDYVVEHLREQLENVLDDLCKKKEKVLLAKRYEKYRVMGANYEEL